MSYTPEDAERAYPPPPVEDAVVIAREMIDEWDYEHDPHGFCHVRPMLISLVAAVAAVERTQDAAE